MENGKHSNYLTEQPDFPVHFWYYRFGLFILANECFICLQSNSADMDSGLNLKEMEGTKRTVRNNIRCPY